MRSYRSFDTLEDRQAGPAWMQRILVNAYRDRLRKESSTVKEVPVEEVDEFSLYRTLAEEDPLPVLRYPARRLPAQLRTRGRPRGADGACPRIYRAPLVLRYMQGFSTKEIAKHPRHAARHDLRPPPPWPQAVRAGAVGVRQRDGPAASGGHAMSAGERMIPCSQAVRQLWDYLGPALSPEDHAEWRSTWRSAGGAAASWSSPRNCKGSSLRTGWRRSRRT